MFYENLFAAKKELGKIAKDSKNPFFNSKYFDINSLLEHVEPVLNNHGLFVIQPIEDGEVKTKIINEEGFGIESGIKLPEITDPQKIGSAVTYYRRYTLQSLLALQAEDDDANLASGHSKPGKKALKQGTPQWDNVMKGIEDGKIKSVADVEKYYSVGKLEKAALEVKIAMP